MSGFPPPLFLTCTTRPSRALCSTLPTNFPCLVLIGSPILLPLVLLFPPRRVDLFVPPTDRKEGQIRFVSFRIVIISGCSWPSQHFCFFKKFHPPLGIVNPRPGSRHVVRPSVVMILVSSTRSCHTCDESWILTKPPTGISWSRNQFFPITSGVSCSRRSPGSCADIGIEGASHRMLLRMNSEPFLSIGLLTKSG